MDHTSSPNLPSRPSVRCSNSNPLSLQSGQQSEDSSILQINILGEQEHQIPSAFILSNRMQCNLVRKQESKIEYGGGSIREFWLYKAKHLNAKTKEGLFV